MIKDLEESGSFFYGRIDTTSEGIRCVKGDSFVCLLVFSTILTPFDVYFSIICYNRKVD